MVSGEVYDESKLRKGFEDLKKFYGEGGYVTFLPEPVLDSDEQRKVMNLTVNIDEGLRYILRSISFTGNTTVPDAVLRREIRLTEGFVFNAKLLEASLPAAESTGTFRGDQNSGLHDNASSGRSETRHHLKSERKASVGYQRYAGGFRRVGTTSCRLSPAPCLCGYVQGFAGIPLRHSEFVAEPAPVVQCFNEMLSIVPRISFLRIHTGAIETRFLGHFGETFLVPLIRQTQ